MVNADFIMHYKLCILNTESVGEEQNSSSGCVYHLYNNSAYFQKKKGQANQPVPNQHPTLFL